ncbi:hypothetical protein PMI19_04989, partial [Pseudomonas sp. GM16]
CVRFIYLTENPQSLASQLPQGYGVLSEWPV